jgi:predicted nucleic acid-binding protein
LEIAITLEKGNLLIIDYLKGRKLVRRLGLRIIGILGLLKAMKLNGLIREVKSVLEKLKR